MDQVRFNLTEFQNATAALAVATSADYSGTPHHLIAAGRSTDTLYVQRIVVSITTSAAKTLTFQDSSGSPVAIAAVPSGQAVGAVVFDFGPEGFPLPVGTGLDLANSGAGVGAALVAQGYRRTAPGTALTPNVAGSFGGL